MWPTELNSASTFSVKSFLAVVRFGTLFFFSFPLEVSVSALSFLLHPWQDVSFQTSFYFWDVTADVCLSVCLLLCVFVYQAT
jgi:hypothetical protein